MAKVAFIGLGVMGYPMAGHLQAAGHSVCVYNRTAAKAADWVAEHGGTAAPTGRRGRSRAVFLYRCAGFRRSGGGGKRKADGDVRW